MVIVQPGLCHFMQVTDLSETNMRDFIKQDGLVFVYFWAGWCKPCRDFSPLFDSAVKSWEYPIMVGKMDCKNGYAFKDRFPKIDFLPIIIGYRDGTEICRLAGGSVLRLENEIKKACLSKTS